MNTQRYQLGIIFHPQCKCTQNLRTLQGYIFYSLLHFTTKLCNFTKFRMLFQDVVIFLPVSNFFKILKVEGPLLDEVKPHIMNMSSIWQCRRTRQIIDLSKASNI